MKLTKSKIQQLTKEVLNEVLGVSDPPEESTDCPEGSEWGVSANRCELSGKKPSGGGYAVTMESIKQIVKEELSRRKEK
tara:strand:+ start:1055 stop:1291 length:237 start_codon:yes stop_codon:yes gene_type:complete